MVHFVKLSVDFRGAGGDLCPFFCARALGYPTLFNSRPPLSPHYQPKYFHQKTSSDQHFCYTKKKSLIYLLKHAEALAPYISVTAEFHEAVEGRLSACLIKPLSFGGDTFVYPPVDLYRYRR